MRTLVFLSTLLATVVAVADADVAGGAPRSVPGASGTVFVTERQLGSVTAFDAASGLPLWHSRTGASPIGVTQPHGTDKVYTSDEGLPPLLPSQLSVFDKRTGELVKTIPMGKTPHHLFASRNGERIYVGEFGQNTVGVVDTSTDTEIAHWVANTDPTARTHAVFVTRDGEDLYATNTRVNRALPGDVAHIDARTGTLLCNTTVGADPSEILVTPDGRTGFVSVRRENKLKELDLSGDCPVLTGREALVGQQPDTLQLTNDGKTVVVTLRNPTAAQFTLVDVAAFKAETFTIPGHAGAGHHWVSTNGKYSFIALESPAGLGVVDNETGSVVADYAYPAPPGGARAHGVFYVPEVLR
jgi:DNA-binding beta-propeller fold protein YncE